MNIFKILSDGDGSIKEPNVSAFLAFLLDPTQSHGLGSKFLESFLNNLVTENLDKFDQLVINNKIKDLSRPDKSGFYIEITNEKTVQLSNQKKRDIDILIEIYNNKNSTLLYTICIENKIRDSAINQNQLIEEIEGIMNKYEEEQDAEQKMKPKHISMIFLTPSFTENSKKAFNEFVGEINKKGLIISANHLIWNPIENNENSVFNILSNILKSENEGRIDPIHEYSKFTIKSFLNFILTGFKSYQEEKDELGKYKKTRLSETEYWTLNKDSELLDLAKEIKEYVCKKYEVEAKYSPTHLTFYTDKVKAISKFGVFFQLTISSKSKFHLTLRKDKNLIDDKLDEYLLNILPDLQLKNKIEHHPHNLTVYRIIIEAKEDFENIGKILIENSYKYLTSQNF